MTSHMPVTRRDLLKLGAGAAATAALAARPAAATEGRFDLTGSSSPLIWKKDLYDQTVLQSFAFDNVHGHIYTLQLRNGTGQNAAGNLCLTKLSLTGTVLGHMYLMGFGHGVQLGVEPSGSSAYLWTETDGVTENGSARGSRLARFRFADGQTLDTSSPALTKYKPIASADNTTCAIDPSRNRLIMRYRSEGAFRFAVYSLPALKAGTVSALFDIAQPAGLGVFQGYAAFGNFLYLLTGEAYSDANPAPGNTHITCLDLRTGGQVQRELTEAGKSLDYREPEGMAIQIAAGLPRLCLGLASGVEKARKASIFYKSAMV